jgi:hypothetical protein
MRTYGIDPNTNQWTLLTQTPYQNAFNPVVYNFTDSVGDTFTVTSTLYTATIDFSLPPISISQGDTLQNNLIVDSFGNTLVNNWENVSQRVLLPAVPPQQYILKPVTNSLFNTYGLTAGETVQVSVGYIWLTTLVQTLRLIEGESPFYGNYGIPAYKSVHTQIAPDAAVARTQAQYSPYFASLAVSKQQLATQPTYNISAIFTDGTVIQSVIAT